MRRWWRGGVAERGGGADDQSTSTEGPRKRSIGLTRPSQTIEAAFSRTSGFMMLLMTACTSADSVVPLKAPAMSTWKESMPKSPSQMSMAWPSR